MLYYLGSHRWLWGRGGWGSQRANALPPVAAVMPFTAATHAVCSHCSHACRTFLATSVISSISHTYRPLAITIHPSARRSSYRHLHLVEWVTSLMGAGPNARARAYTALPRVVTPPAALERPFQCPAMF